ncbi:alkaline phosphatase family protein [Maribellus maritimus]|uniref:hypothetical protein n=1 Tax=Maribellus maritimus TaxID=2870838 RepID=UPI001EEA2D30|nr:hypothetical protein [Maribellus maritimus]MCG6188318.1 hypothetical protein [Maribellus maritimus]
MGYIDIFPTLKAITQGKTTNDNEFDSINVLENMRGNGKNVERKWFAYLDQNVEKRERFAVNYNNWKLVLERDAQDRVSRCGALNMLFYFDSLNIESNDVKEENPKLLKELLQAVETFSDTKSDHQISRYNVGKSGFTAP